MGYCRSRPGIAEGGAAHAVDALEYTCHFAQQPRGLCGRKARCEIAPRATGQARLEQIVAVDQVVGEVDGERTWQQGAEWREEGQYAVLAAHQLVIVPGDIAFGGGRGAQNEGRVPGDAHAIGGVELAAAQFARGVHLGVGAEGTRADGADLVWAERLLEVGRAARQGQVAHG